MCVVRVPMRLAREYNQYKGKLRRYLLYSIFIWGMLEKSILNIKYMQRKYYKTSTYLGKTNKCYTRRFGYSCYRPCAHT